MATTMEIRIDKTKKGYPAIWECGGGMTNTGYSQIIANSDGSPKNLYGSFEAIIKVAKEKATCYHCRSPHFIEY